MRIADLFCGAGGAAKGLHNAGFEVVGFDIKPQKNYPYEFHQADALEVDLSGFDAVWASPPCQRFSAMQSRWGRQEDHPDLVAPIRKMIEHLPHIIENVVGAPLISPVMLCGTMFGLQTSQGNQLRRHRIFETSFQVVLTPPCAHNTASAIGVHGGGQHPGRRRTIGVYGNAGGSSTRDGISFFGIDARKEVMGIDWMTGSELNQAIPPAYSEFLGRQLMKAIVNKAMVL